LLAVAFPSGALPLAMAGHFFVRPLWSNLPMSTTMSRPSRQAGQNPADQLRGDFVAMKLSFKWFGVRRTLSDDQKNRAAASFGAESKYLSAGKKLIDTTHPKFRSVSQVRSRASQFWKARSMPYPESGIRLIRNQDIDSINQQMSEYQDELRDAVASLENDFGSLKSAARTRLGSLYAEADYPDDLSGLFDIGWEFTNVEPPEYLLHLSPQVYQQECERVRVRFEEAVELAEQAFTEELSRLVTHLAERLSGAEDGKPKIFRDSAIENMTEFFSRFRMLNVHSNQQLDDLAQRANEIVRGIAPSDLRNNAGLRQQVATQLSSVQSMLDGMMVDRPRRRILRTVDDQVKE
jgi:hypothetical protein